MIFVPGRDLGLEDKLFKVAGPVTREMFDVILFDQSQQTSRVEESS